MTVIDFPVAVRPGLFARVATTVQDWRRRRAVFLDTYRELSALGDRELADLDLSRAQLTQIARDAALRA